VSRTGRIFIFGLLFVASAGADSLFNMTGGKSGTLIAQKKARFEVGDIITVLVRENVEASTQANTQTRKEADVETEADKGDNEFLVSKPPGGHQLIKPERLPNWKIETNNEARTRGQTVRSNKLVTTVSCIVTRVFDNGNIQIEGRRRVTVNREDSLIEVSGLVRAKDVSPASTIESSRIADAVVQLRGRGPLWNNQRRGLFTKLLDWFSPF